MKHWKLFVACAAMLVSRADAKEPQAQGVRPTWGDARPVEKVPANARHISIAPRGGEPSSALVVRTTRLPDASLELLTCEAILDGDKDFGMFPVKLTPSDWKSDGDTLAYTYVDPNGLKLRFAATPEDDSVLLEYTLTNGTKETLARAHVHPCLPTVGAATFYPGTAAEAKPGREGRVARAGRNDFSELYERLFLWSKHEKFSFRSSELGKSEVHTAFMFKNQPPIEWNWWKNDQRTFDVPLIGLESKDKQHVLALAFRQALWASSNVGDSRACMHLFPSFGKIEPGKSATMSGRLYVLAGNADDALKRFEADFPHW